ncbi:MAG: GTPase ObgE [Clostridia bacterium]|nr:GTPase ObgE [Clostridia bacterium]
MFIDKIKIFVKAGDGGNGAVSFRREKYVAKGGPDGGDGGNGGNIIFRIDEGANTLLAFRYKRKFVAENGGDGQGSKFHGKNGEDVIISVPRGTLIRESESGRIIMDMSEVNEFTVCRGGRGGWGNKHFATPTRQIPRFAKSGLPGEEKEITLELKMIADVGLAGLPSAGKSSLLAALSAARPKIAEYHFTTLEPSLGVVNTGGESGFVMADIPGLIEGAAEGAGLGHDFLRHIERCRMLVQVVDVSGSEGRSPADDLRVISDELMRFSPELASRPRIVAANKADLLTSDESEFLEIPSVYESAAELEEEAAKMGYRVIYISAAQKINLAALKNEIKRMLDELPPVLTYESELPDVSEAETACSPDDVTVARGDDGSFICEGDWLKLLVGRVNFDDRESLMYFENSLNKAGIIDKLRDSGCAEGDTVSMYGIEFDFID